ncbi:HK97-gp10 family putative phage morphogenesis protein [Bacillus pacificus]|uniref:HK97-gp10 family putative phage morphogenesis protein n=1 Tax=Bacillus pacificus TaxID=2026187 RepID=UPI0021CE4155|nr:HK97-gp10 family putative phage morphogenesis protein [Bacillus pacificus]MCU5070091.1 HK97 gp10 family phage protein [Bacillus pacificus]
MANSVEIEFSSNMEQVKTQINNLCVERVTGATIHLQNQVKKNLTGSRSGKQYKIPHTSRKYTASKPGEAPAVRTGDLLNSIKYNIKRSQSEVLGAVGSDLQKAIWLENGTSHMEARPFLLKTFERERRELKRQMGG